MIDAQIHMAAVSGHQARIPQQGHPCHIHRHHERRGEAGVKPADAHEIVHGRDGIAAKNRDVLAQLFQGQVQRPGTADGVAVGVLMA